MRASSVAAAVLATVAVLLASAPAVGVVSREDLKAAIDRACRDANNEDERAELLIAAGREPGVDPNLAVALLTAGAESGIKSADTARGLDAGIDALCDLTCRAPAKAPYYRARLNVLCQEAYRRCKADDQPDKAADVMRRIEAAGDKALAAGKWEDAKACYMIGLRMAGLGGRSSVPLENKTRCAAHFVDAVERFERLKAFARAGDKAAAGKLVIHCLTELDDPAGAQKLLAGDSGEILRTCVPLAARDPDGLPNAALSQLSDWYAQSLAGKTDDFGRQLMLRRALHYARLAVSKSGGAAGQGGDRVEALTRQLDAFTYVNRTLGRLRFLDLMPLIDIERDTTKDKWRFAESTFIASDANGMLTLPVEVEGSYRLKLQIAKNKEAKVISVGFPVGGKKLWLRLEEYFPNLLDRLRDQRDKRRAEIRQNALHAQRGGGKPTGGWGGRGGGRGGGAPAPPSLWLRASLRGIEGRDRIATAKPINPQYAKHPWVVYTIEISVKIDGDKATVAAVVGASHKINWQGEIKDINSSPRKGGDMTVWIDDPSIALKSARITLYGGSVRYAYEDRSPDVPAGP